jgi:uncharacterized iron-regulated membrane protein
MGFWRRPQSVFARRALFQIHLWTGLAAAAYAIFIGMTGSLLMFRSELQERAYPRFFAPAPAGAVLADPSVVASNLTAAYPGYRFSTIEYPTSRRGTFLSYVARGDELLKVFADPVSGRIVGDLGSEGWIQELQDLHFNFDAGQTGFLLNGIGSAALLLMSITGLMIWWPGVAKVRQAFVVRFDRGWKRITWELHGAAGIWTVMLVIMWAISGIYFSFPVPFRNAVGTVVTLSRSTPPKSRAPGDLREAVTPAQLIAKAEAMVPAAQPARVFVPSGPTGSYGIVLARGVHGDWDTSDEVTLYFDRYSGEWLRTDDKTDRTAGDTFMIWLGLLHVGTFGGIVVKLIWFVAGLALPLLAVTGFVMWWNRVVKRGVQAGVTAPARRKVG